MSIDRMTCRLVLVSAVFLLVSGASAAEKPPRPSGPAAIAQAFTAKSPVDFKKTALADAAAFLADQHRINVVLDRRALDRVGLSADTPVTCKLQRASLGTVLRLMLLPLDLTYTVRHEVLLITTPEVAEENLQVKVYDVRDLADQGEDRPAYAPRYDYDTLVELIMAAVAPDSWDDVGGPGAIQAGFGALVVAQTDDVQGEIATVLDVLRKARTSRPGDVFRPMGPTAAFASQALDRASTFDLEDVPLADAIEFASTAAEVDAYVDTRALDNAGLSSATPVTLRVKKATVRSALEQMLSPLDLDWRWEDNVLMITTDQEAEATPELRAHNAADLLLPPGADPEDEAVYDYDTLVELLFSVIAPDTWDMVGGSGTVAPFENLLIVVQTADAHDQIESLFSDLRALDGGLKTERPARQLRRTLGGTTTVEFVETPLADVLRFLCQQHSLRVEIDHRALEQAGIDLTDASVTLSASDISLRSALELVLEGHDLTWIPLGRDVLLITTTREAEAHLACRVYDVSDLLNPQQPDAEELMRLISATVASGGWVDVGGPGSMAMLRSRLVVRQTEPVHEQIERLLDGLRAADGKQAER